MNQREIKFRAWDSEINTMLYDNNGYLRRNSGTCFQISSNGVCVPAYLEESVVLKPILMQYTGLKDRTGKEIYEGDLLVYPHELDVKCEVKFQNGSFITDDNKKEVSSLGDILPECEIIGNIYEHPHLLTT